MSRHNTAAEILETLATVDRIDRLYRPAHVVNFGESVPFADRAAAARAIVLASRKLHSLSEFECNGIPRWDSKAGRVLASWTDEDEALAERDRERAQARVKAALPVLFGSDWAEWLEIEWQRDPRGAPVKLWIKGERDKSSPVGAF